jgi:hypothetical protein
LLKAWRIEASYISLGTNLTKTLGSGISRVSKSQLMHVSLTELARLREQLSDGRPRWVSISSLPFSKPFVYDLLKTGLVESAVVSLPGSKRTRRLIDAQSLDRWIEQKMENQKNEKHEETPVS